VYSDWAIRITTAALSSSGEPHRGREDDMAESVYKVIELVGTSTESWEKAASAAISRAGRSLDDLRIAEVVKLDMQIENGSVVTYRARMNVSFKFREGD
jgi:flavin-binding protein dodecin